MPNLQANLDWPEILIINLISGIRGDDCGMCPPPLPGLRGDKGVDGFPGMMSV